MEVRKKNKEKKEEETLLTFLRMTKEGKYTEIKKTPLPTPYTRVKEETVILEDEYYYSFG